ncbi:MAG TPA: rhomboid family intramembrane serine protease [Burkholderiaceae bacterium]|nr:rhomboid family intramembrane serine protease [Burkholderiaceae bacterium]
MSAPVDPQEFAWRLHEATPRAWVTPALVAINVAVWLLNLATGLSPISPRAIELLAWGGNHLPLTVEEPWRLLTATFLHGGIIHLAFNMWALWDTGRLAERFYGNGQLALIYLVAGLAGSIASLFFSARAGVSVGASGAIFGVVGCLLAAIFTKAHKLPAGLVASMRSSMLMFVGYSLFMGFVAGFIDNAAHIGGLVGGFAMGMVLAEKFDIDEYRRQALPRAAVATVLAAAALYAAWSWVPRPAA